ncbi:MAG TPA: methylenetetrahydrofolate reductase C-terminal domain-containing protein, partial [bacterium]|nr:methylenetetrahydrofolate reductase C-terminal domain-containing protein [bacterium]
MEITLIDYTRYRLKPASELQNLMAPLERIFVLWCRKCFQEFKEIQESECQSFLESIGALRERVTACQGVDFLCREVNGKNLASSLGLPGYPAVGVIACGIGVQVVAGLLKKVPVLALADSIPQSGNATSEIASHGLALGPIKCAGCGQCYLNQTGGICPVVNCAKSLVNGPCGGAKAGKCEVDNTRPCAWEEIYQRLAGQKRAYLAPFSISDHHSFPVSERKKMQRQVRNRRQLSFAGGVYPPEKKDITARREIQPFPAPEKVFLYLSQHTGAPATPLVKPGQRVLLGEKIAESTGFVSAPVHASVSGIVEGLQEVYHPLLNKTVPAIIITNDGQDEHAGSARSEPAWSHLPEQELLARVGQAGVVGLGGAMFPTAVKLATQKKIDTLLINGCECEPYLNADNRLMLEKASLVLEGAAIAARILKAIQVLVGIEENKPEALARMGQLASRLPGFKVVGLATKYPQGNERLLVFKLLGRQVPKGGLPLDVGAVVLNVATCLAIRQAVCEQAALTERVVTVSGENLARAGNFLVRIGTPLRKLLDHCLAGRSLTGEEVVRAGGPMMGVVQENLEGAVVKG